MSSVRVGAGVRGSSHGAMGILRSALLAGAAFALPGTPVLAQTPSADSAEEEEIVVTAQGRTQRLQDVPISAEVFGAESLAEQNITSLLDISEDVPSVSFGINIGTSTDMYIRGVGSGPNASFDQSVSTFVDGIYHGRARTSGGTFLDLQRVEILKGPQSTFFGNNAVAGALNIVSALPGDHNEGWFRALYGMHGDYALEGAVSGPITDTFGARATVTFNGTEGWIRDVNTDQDAPNVDNVAGRVVFRYTPASNLEATLKLEGSSSDDHSGLFFLTRPAQAGLVDDEISYSPGSSVQLDTQDAVLNVSYEFAGHTLTSITGFHDYDFNMNLDADFQPVQLVHVQAPENYSQWSQELRLASPTGQTIEYLAGVYFQAGDLHREQILNYFLLNGPITALGSGGPPFDAVIPYLPLSQRISGDVYDQTYSVFGALTWNVTDRLRLNAGLRATQVHKSFDWEQIWGTATQSYGGTSNNVPAGVQNIIGLLNQGRAGSISLSREDDHLMPSFNVQYRLTPEAMIYGSYANGFKAGGFNLAEVARAGVFASLFPYGPEQVDAYEAGLKSQWLDGALTLNIALFRSEYEDLQVSINTFDPSAGTVLSLVRNAAASRSQGVELETRWDVTPDLNLSVVATYLESTYTDYPVSPVVNNAGANTPHAPRWSYVLAGEYTFPTLPNYFELTTQLSLHHSDDFGINVFGNPHGEYDLLNGRLTLVSPGGDWFFDLIGENLTDEQAIQGYGGPPVGTSAQYVVRYAEPTNFAFQVRRRW